MYSEFSNVYDNLMYDFNYSEAFEFISRNLLGKDVLEMACGTGNLTTLLEVDYNVDAFDNSVDMLSIARNKLQCNLYMLDMRKFSMGKVYDGVLCICDSLNYILEIDEMEKVFENVYHHLKEDGVFIFDMNTEYNFINNFGDNIYKDEVDNVFYVWENFYNGEEKLNYYNIDFFLKENSLYRRFSEEHIEKSYSVNEINDLLLKVGFVDIEVYDGYSNRPYNEKTKRMVFKGRK